ncbi:MAG TPA: hypothetical protein VGH89_22390, partial [Pseudonocardia sp.]
MPGPGSPCGGSGGTDGTDWSKIGHTALDLAGFVPVVGSVASGANAVWYWAQGDKVNALWSAAGAIPGAGDAALASKLAARGVQAYRAVRGAEKAGAVVEDGSRAARLVEGTAPVAEGGTPPGGVARPPGPEP